MYLNPPCDGLVFYADGTIVHVGNDAAPGRVAPSCVVAASSDYRPNSIRAGWLARLSARPDPASALEKYGDVEREFVNGDRIGTSETLGGQLARVYASLPDSTYEASVYNGGSGLRRWFVVDHGRVTHVTKYVETARGWLGLPPTLAQARAIAAAASRVANRLPPLLGTARQVAWGEALRARVVARCPSELLGELARFETAKWWIDARDFGFEETIARAVAPLRPGVSERVGRVLADLAYAACEPVGEVPAAVTMHVLLPAVGVGMLWMALNGVIPNGSHVQPKDSDDELICAYRARWAERLASSSAVMLKEPAPGSVTVRGTEADRPAVAAPGTIHFAVDTGESYIFTDSEDGYGWRPIA